MEELNVIFIQVYTIFVCLIASYYKHMIFQEVGVDEDFPMKSNAQ
jgi:hypothetical protein